MPRPPAAEWSDAPSSTELAALVRCEGEFAWERNTGRTRASGSRSRRRRVGVAVHARTQEQMEAFHNSAPPSRPSNPDRTGRVARAPAPIGSREQLHAAAAALMAHPLPPLPKLDPPTPLCPAPARSQPRGLLDWLIELFR